MFLLLPLLSAAYVTISPLIATEGELTKNYCPLKGSMATVNGQASKTILEYRLLCNVAVLHSNDLIC